MKHHFIIFRQWEMVYQFDGVGRIWHHRGVRLGRSELVARTFNNVHNILLKYYEKVVYNRIPNPTTFSPKRQLPQLSQLSSHRPPSSSLHLHLPPPLPLPQSRPFCPPRFHYLPLPLLPSLVPSIHHLHVLQPSPLHQGHVLPHQLVRISA